MSNIIAIVGRPNVEQMAREKVIDVVPEPMAQERRV